MPEKSELVLTSSPDTAQDVNGNDTIGGKSEPPSLSFLPSLSSHPLADSLQASLSQLLSSERYTHPLTGLMAVTGLTSGELLKSRKFSPHPDDPFALLFSSTISTSFDTLITLVRADSVLHAIALLKQHPDVQPLLYLSPNDIDSRCLPYVNRTISSHLPYKSLDEMISTYRSLTDTPEPPQIDKPKRPPSTIYNIYSDDRSRLTAIASSLQLDGSQSEVFHSLLDWVEQHLSFDNSPSPASLEAISHQAQTLAWLTNEITSLRERVSSLSRERDDLQSQLEQATTQEPEVARLRAENERLSSELAQANATLSIFRQLLDGSPLPSPMLKEQEHLPKPTTVNSEVKTAAPEPTTVTPLPLPNTTSRRARQDGGARARALSIWNALQEWNRLHPAQTFALTTGLLETVFHVHRQAAHDFLQEFSQQIDDYHRALSVTTVRTHNRGKDSQPLKAFVLQRLDR